MRYQPRAEQMIRLYKGKEVPKRQPFRRPCNKCEKKFQPTGRTNYLCRPCITLVRQEKKAERIALKEKKGKDDLLTLMKRGLIDLEKGRVRRVA